MTIQDIAVFGAGGFGLEVVMLLEQINEVKPTWAIKGFFDDGQTLGAKLNGYAVLGGMEALNTWPSKLAIVLAIGDPGKRREVARSVRNARVVFPSIMHPSVIAGRPDTLDIGEGCVFCAGTILTTNLVVGKHVIVNLGCTLGHESRIGDFCSFMPACNVSGGVTIRPGSYWGTGAKVIHGVTVGGNSIIGAGAVVIRDVPDHATAVGVPAKVVGTRQCHEKTLVAP